MPTVSESSIAARKACSARSASSARLTLFHQVADQPEAPEHAGGEQDDGGHQRTLYRIVRRPVAGDAHEQAGSRRIERDDVALVAIALDAGLGGVELIVIVDDLDLVFFGEPTKAPGWRAGFRAGRARPGHRQGAGSSPWMGTISSMWARLPTQEERLAVMGFAHVARPGQMPRLTDGWAEGLDFLLRRVRCLGKASTTLRPGCPATGFRATSDEFLSMCSARRRKALRRSGRLPISSANCCSCSSLLFRWNCRLLLQPQNILDQRGPVFLNFVAMQQPEQ